MPFDLDTLKAYFEKANKAIDWIVEEVIRQRNWRSLLVLIDVVLFLALNPYQKPFPNLLTLFPQLKRQEGELPGWYVPAFWSLIALIFVGAVIVAAHTKRKSTKPAEVETGAIKGLLPFSYDDAEDFAHLQREQNLRECLQAISDEHWRFGVLSGESGAGKTSFLQAGLWPALGKRKARCVYVKFSDLDPFESVKHACRKHLPACNNAADDADFLSLLNTAAAQDPTPVVLLFDQFEQFFGHRKRKSDRAPFVQALARWFTDMEPLPVKLLITIRSDFHDRLNDLQKAMRYSLGPAQSFRLELFEPHQATEVFCFLAEKEGLEYDRKFISEMTRQEMADTEDGLISPVDVQVLARMIQRQTTHEGRAFNRSTFQKLGGVEGLLDRYLTGTLETRETQSRRQSAIKVLLGLIDLERNTREGALTLEALRRKLGSEISDAELKDAVSWLQRGDVRLISPSSENEEEKFELVHERMIPALRRLAGDHLGDAKRAEQLLNRRTNEWLGNGRDSRYLFSWAELRLINKHKRYITWGKERQAKEELMTASRRHYRLQLPVASLMVLLGAMAGWVGLKGKIQRLELEAENNRRISYIAQVRTMQQDLENADIKQVEETLNALRPEPGKEDLRGFEWNLFFSLTHRDLKRWDREYPIEAAAFSPDGHLLVMGEKVNAGGGNSEHKITLYDFADGQELKSYRLPASNVFTGMVFSLDGRRIAAIGPAGAATLCDTLSGECLPEFKGHAAELSAIALSPDGRWLMTADLTGVVKIWDAMTGREKFTLNIPSLVSQAAFSPDGHLLVIVDQSSAVRMWETTTGREMPPFKAGKERLIGVAFFPDGKRLLTATPEGVLQIWDVRARRLISKLDSHSGRVDSIAFSQDGNTLVTGSADRTVRLWSTNAGRTLTIIKGHSSSITALALSPDRKYLITGSRDKTFRLWDVSSKQEPILPEEKVGSFLTTAFTASRDLLAFGITADNVVKLWNLSAGTELARFNKSEETVLFAVFSPDRKLIATGGTGKLVRLWDTATGQLVRTLTGHKGLVLGASFSPDGRKLISGSELNELKLWEVATGWELASLTAEVDNDYCAAFSPDGRYLTTACRNGSVKLWDLSNMKVILTFSKHEGRIRDIIFSPDGRLIAAGDEGKWVKIWDVATGNEIITLLLLDSVQRLAFTPDGKRLITGGQEGRVQLWDITTGRKLIMLNDHRSAVTSVTFSADGDSLATSGIDGSVHLWRVWR